ncbi:MAG: vWA domain-containing protein [Acidimicrobiales bacterium]
MKSAQPEVAFAVALGRSLRAAGLGAPIGSTLAFSEALGVLGLEHAEQVFAAGAACYCRRPEDRAEYAAVFSAVARAFGGILLPGDPPATREDTQREKERSLGEPEIDGEGKDEDEEKDEGARPEVRLETAEEQGDDSAGAEEDGGEVLAIGRASMVEVLRDKDFGSCSEQDLLEISRLLGQLRKFGPRRTSRRFESSASSGSGPYDLRRTLRHALRTQGEPLVLDRRRRGTRRRRIVLLVDVSGSMTPYARTLLRYAHASVVSHRAVEVFLLGTRCTRVTRELGWKHSEGALRRAERAAPDMSGGTRLGESLQQFNSGRGIALARGSVVVICSDGWDRGEPSEIAEQMSRIARVAHQVIWVNPLKAGAGYEPLARGMAAALPYVDHFVSGHSLAALEDLSEVIAS